MVFMWILMCEFTIHKIFLKPSLNGNIVVHTMIMTF